MARQGAGAKAAARRGQPWCRDTAASERGGRDSQDVGRKQANEGHSPPGDRRAKVFPGHERKRRARGAERRTK